MIVPDKSFLKRISLEGRRRVCILGSTGSIGTSALEFIDRNQNSFEVHSLVAGCQVEKLAGQIRRFRPKFAVVPGQIEFKKLRELLSPSADCSTEILCGAEAINEVAADPDSDIVLAAIVGSVGLPSIAAAVKAGKLIALANKESLVCAGELLSRMLADSKATIIPVDSEHSALFQMLEGQSFKDVSSLTLTASGGPFLGMPKSQLAFVSPEQAINHPRWKMGAKISVDSATLVNKALEVIEAHWLFGLAPAEIEVVVHPQSIVHAMVNLVDGASLAHLSVPDMIGPISFALGWPGWRTNGALPRLNLVELRNLEFLSLDDDRFPAVQLAKSCLSEGGLKPALFNIANEVAVEAFLAGKLSFDRIFSVIEQGVSFDYQLPGSIPDYCRLELEIRETLRSKLLSN